MGGRCNGNDGQLGCGRDILVAGGGRSQCDCQSQPAGLEECWNAACKMWQGALARGGLQLSAAVASHFQLFASARLAPRTVSFHHASSLLPLDVVDSEQKMSSMIVAESGFDGPCVCLNVGKIHARVSIVCRKETAMNLDRRRCDPPICESRRSAEANFAPRSSSSATELSLEIPPVSFACYLRKA